MTNNKKDLKVSELMDLPLNDMVDTILSTLERYLNNSEKNDDLSESRQNRQKSKETYENNESCDPEECNRCPEIIAVACDDFCGNDKDIIKLRNRVIEIAKETNGNLNNRLIAYHIISDVKKEFANEKGKHDKCSNCDECPIVNALRCDNFSGDKEYGEFINKVKARAKRLNVDINSDDDEDFVMMIIDTEMRVKVTDEIIEDEKSEESLNGSRNEMKDEFTKIFDEFIDRNFNL